jgi:hypothetical protein
VARLRLLLLLATAAAAISPGALAAGRTDAWNLHPGSRGPRVAALQWMLAGHCPNRYAVRCGGKVKPTLHRYTAGIDGARTGSGVVAMKYRVGYPKAGECGASRSYLNASVGPYFFALLKGQKQRPTCWVVLAAKRIKLPAPGVSAAALKVKAFEVAQLGVTEQPAGSNRGPRISYDAAGVRAYQAATGAYGAAWCVSFQQASFLAELGVTFADRTAGVFYAVGYARSHGWLNAKAKVGELVAFLDYQGHMGFVAKITASGFSSIEGNQANGVHEVFHAYGSRPYAFIAIPGVA